MGNDNMLFADVLIVGAGPSGLSSAIHLADELKKTGETKKIMVIEKGNAVGAHILSGAILKTDAFKELLSKEEFDGLPFDCEVTSDSALRLSDDKDMEMPFHPPYMNNMGNKIASLGQICRYLAELAESKGVEVYTGFSVSELLYEDGKVAGVKTVDTGLDEHGVKQKNFQEGTSVKAKVVVLAEGVRGSLAKQLKDKFYMRRDSNPQVYSLGVKELWSVPEGNIKEGEVYHTFGYPLNVNKEFGGGFVYGLKDNKVAVGFAVGLDYDDPTLNPHSLMQVWKQHPSIRKFLEGGSIVEFGAKALPEGGWNSVSQLYTDNVLILGDSAGFIAMPALKGVHLSVASGMCAAKTMLSALRNGDTSEASLSMYQKLIDESRIKSEMYPTRNFRAVMTQGLYVGAVKFGVQLLTGGACAFVPKLGADNTTLKTKAKFSGVPFAKRFEGKLEFDKKLTFDRDTSVFYSGTFHEEEQPTHLHVEDYDSYNKINIQQFGTPAQYFCPADVYEEHADKNGDLSLKIHSENCVHCKTCDIKAPNSAITWTTPYGADGPQYQNM